MSIYEYDEEKHMKAEREEHYALGFQQGYYEAFLEMGLSEEEARRRAAEKCSLEETDNVGEHGETK